MANIKFQTREEIIEHYGISLAEFEKIKNQVSKMRLLDIVFHFPQGVQRDIALFIITTAR